MERRRLEPCAIVERSFLTGVVAIAALGGLAIPMADGRFQECNPRVLPHRRLRPRRACCRRGCGDLIWTIASDLAQLRRLQVARRPVVRDENRYVCADVDRRSGAQARAVARPRPAAAPAADRRPTSTERRAGARASPGSDRRTCSLRLAGAAPGAGRAPVPPVNSPLLDVDRVRLSTSADAANAQERDIALISEIAYQAWEGIERMRAQSELRCPGCVRRPAPGVSISPVP